MNAPIISHPYNVLIYCGGKCQNKKNTNSDEIDFCFVDNQLTLKMTRFRQTEDDLYNLESKFDSLRNEVVVSDIDNRCYICKLHCVRLICFCYVILTQSRQCFGYLNTNLDWIDWIRQANNVLFFKYYFSMFPSI